MTNAKNEKPTAKSITKSKNPWTDADEEELRAMLARRKATGYRRPSRDVNSQLLKVGDIGPNPKTVAASIVALVGLKGVVSRRELLADMAETQFPHRKAQPNNPKWCQDYIAGALRYEYLQIVPAESAAQQPVADTPTQTPVRVRESASSAAEA